MAGLTHFWLISVDYSSIFSILTEDDQYYGFSSGLRESHLLLSYYLALFCLCFECRYFWWVIILRVGVCPSNVQLHLRSSSDCNFPKMLILYFHGLQQVCEYFDIILTQFGFSHFYILILPYPGACRQTIYSDGHNSFSSSGPRA